MGSERRIYFKNLSGIRFFAATAVILHHVEQYKSWAGLPNIWGNTTIDALGHKAVSMFFVLSGFLITYLLLAEERKTSTISIKDFYVRRILKIWPLYFFIVAICLFVLPNVLDLSRLGSTLYDEYFWLKLLLLVLVLPNVVRLFWQNIVGANQLWSIGVEEQFYLVWPFLIKWTLKRVVQFLLLFIVAKFLITIGLVIWVALTNASVANVGLNFWVLLQIEQMAIGAIGAWAVFHQKEKFLRICYSKLAWSFSLIILILLFIVPVHHWLLSYFEAVIFLLIILNLSTNPAIKVNMEHPLLVKLGNISYGIYMYHTICITLCLYALQFFNLHKENWIAFNVALYVLSVALTIVISYFSFEYFEKLFLKYKEKFMIVKSGK